MTKWFWYKAFPGSNYEPEKVKILAEGLDWVEVQAETSSHILMSRQSWNERSWPV